MAKQILVIGLGQFGTALVRSLHERGGEVLAVDRDEARIRAVMEMTAEAVCFDATDESALARLGPERRDACVCAIGDESREDAIICTALLRQMGAKRLVARASAPLHERILRLVGAHDVVNPEREFGERYADRLLHQGVLGGLSISGDLVLSELALPEAFAGRSLAQLELPGRHGVTVVAVRRAGAKTIELPDPSSPLALGDVLVVVGRPGALDRLE